MTQPLPEGTRYVDLTLPRTLLTKVEPAEVPGTWPGLYVSILCFGGTQTLRDSLLEVLEEGGVGITNLTLHVPLEQDPERAATSREVFELISEEQVELTVFLRRDVTTVSRPYDIISFIHESGTFEILAH